MAKPQQQERLVPLPEALKLTRRAGFDQLRGWRVLLHSGRKPLGSVAEVRRGARGRLEEVDAALVGWALCLRVRTCCLATSNAVKDRIMDRATLFTPCPDCTACKRARKPR